MGFGVLRYKIWYDLWENKGRTLRVIAIIAVGAFAVGVAIGAKEFIQQDMARTWQASHPATIGFEVKPAVNETILESLENLEGVDIVDGWQQQRIQWRPNPDQPWQSAFLVAIDNYDDQILRQLILDDGEWPDRKLMGVQRGRHLVVGDKVELEVKNKIHQTELNGVLYNASHPPEMITPEPMFFTTNERFQQLTGEPQASLVLATIPNYSDAQIVAAADLIQHDLEKQGIEVEPALLKPGGFKTRTNHPDRFIAQDALDGIFLVLTVMAGATFLLGLLLVYNTINAIIVQQINQIGIMKAIGAGFGKILLVYFTMVFIYGLLALFVAVPLGALGAYGLRLGLVGRLQMIPGPFDFSTTAILVQVAITLLVPLLVATLPILSGVRITVREAISTYGLAAEAGLIDRLLNKAQYLPRMVSLTISNTFRNKKRVALTQVTLVGAGVIFMMVVHTRTSLLHTFGDVLFSILDANVMLDLEGEGRIEELEALTLTYPEVTAVELWSTAAGSARLFGQPEANDDSPIKLRGIPQPSTTYVPQIKEGRWLTEADDYSIVLNQELAEELGVGVGDRITVDIPTKREADWLVVGLVFEPIDQDSALVPRETLLKETRQVGRGNAIRVQLAHDGASQEATTAQDLRDLYEANGFEVLASSNDTAHRMIELRTEQMSILIGLLSGMAVMIAVVGAIALSGTLSINVLERTREIGVMRAIGASHFVIAGQFVGEGLILGWLSWLLAIPFSIPVAQIVVSLLSVLLNVDLVYQFSMTGVLAWFGIITILSVIASWFPAQKAAQTSVRESLAYV